MRISDWSSNVCSSDLLNINGADVPYYLARDSVFSPDVRGDRKRPSVNAALQWAPNSSSVYTAEFFWTGFRQTTFNNLFFSFVDWWGSLGPNPADTIRSEEHTSELQSLMRLSYAVFCLKKKKRIEHTNNLPPSFTHSMT